ncbi:serine hydrolase domain-containing protein [Pseudomonas cremoricolorata]|uniref:Beta-lactamase n=1 Tax=Pseudomonas cremoricolorata TaxID=157783 RepID=A0A089Y7Z2_9PSED|nr:serine hydrolase [Pseudomonas cremoricolorata]AIR87978.1 beta-lactamase [Pseudomonas cremoricolorata]
MVRLLQGVGLMLLCACAAAQEVWPVPDWQRADNALNWQALDDYAFPAQAASGRAGVRSDALLVIRDGRIVYERYRSPTTAATAHLTWSVSKSVLATVLGVAYGQQRFALTDSAHRYYSALHQHAGIRLIDLLHWASGLDWQEDYEYAPLNSSVVAMLYTRGRQDMAGYTAARPAAAAPGTRFLYSSGDSNLLAAALRGMLPEQDAGRFARQALFDPLGIGSAVWERDAAGTLVGSSYLYLSARDLARIGLLLLRDGRWQDQQLLPKAWVDFNRAPFALAQAEAAPGEPIAGGHWWLNQPAAGRARPWPDAPADTYAALGHWGQALYVVPSERLLIVRYGDDRGASFSHNALLARVLAVLVEEAR